MQRLTSFTVAIAFLASASTAWANGVPTDAEILRVVCTETACQQANPATLEAGIVQFEIDASPQRWALMFDGATSSFPHLASGAVWVIGTRPNGSKSWDDPVDYRITTVTELRGHVNRRGYIRVEFGRNRRHGASMLVAREIPPCQRGPDACEEYVNGLETELATANACKVDELYNPRARKCVAIGALVSELAPTLAPAAPTPVVVAAQQSFSNAHPYWTMGLVILAITALTEVVLVILLLMGKIERLERRLANTREELTERARQIADHTLVLDTLAPKLGVDLTTNPEDPDESVYLRFAPAVAAMLRALQAGRGVTVPEAINARMAEIAELKTGITQREQVIAGLHKANTERDTAIAQLRGKVSRLMARCGMRGRRAMRLLNQLAAGALAYEQAARNCTALTELLGQSEGELAACNNALAVLGLGDTESQNLAAEARNLGLVLARAQERVAQATENAQRAEAALCSEHARAEELAGIANGANARANTAETALRSLRDNRTTRLAKIGITCYKQNGDVAADLREQLRLLDGERDAVQETCMQMAAMLDAGFMRFLIISVEDLTYALQHPRCSPGSRRGKPAHAARLAAVPLLRQQIAHIAQATQARTVVPTAAAVAA